MIRFVWIASLLAVMCIVLYLPSAVPPERFLQVLKAEHEVNERVWGTVASNRVLSRMLDMQQAAAPVSAPPPPTVQVAQQPAVNRAMADGVSQMSKRMFDNPYFRSIDALFMLVCYRLSAMVEMLPILIVFALICFVDGYVIRLVRAKEFVAHNAEVYGISGILAVLVFCGVVLASFLPVEFHPGFVLVALLAMLFTLSRAVANYHVIG